MVREALITAIERALTRARLAGAEEVLPSVELLVPPAGEPGDYTTNVALVVAERIGESPRTVAELVRDHLEAPTGLLARVEVGASGRLTFSLSSHWLAETLQTIAQAPYTYGRSEAGAGERVLIEFVSAHPTGPLALAHGRGAVLGDVLARLLEWCGHAVSRESYVNDCGDTIERFARAVENRYFELLGDRRARPLDDGFPREHVTALARGVASERGAALLDLPREESRRQFRTLARDATLALQQATLARLGVEFDRWFLESDLHAGGQVEAVVADLLARGAAYRDEGAIWLRAREFEDVLDRPLVRSNGAPSYLAADLAYHRDKFERGFDRVIDLWRPDHQEYAARTRAGWRALGLPEDRLEIIIFQNVLLKKSGEVMVDTQRMGNPVLLDEVIEAVGRDAARFFFLLRPVASPLEFDVDLAREPTLANPLYAAQAAHVECGRLAAEAGSASIPPAALEDADARALARLLVEFPGAIRAAAEEREPYRLARYVQDLAARCHAFLAAELEPPSARAALAKASRIVLANSLSVLGVSAPESLPERAAATSATA